MSDARTLLLELLAVIPNGERVAALFADDGVVELPFLHALGMPTRHQGRTQALGEASIICLRGDLLRKADRLSCYGNR